MEPVHSWCVPACRWSVHLYPARWHSPPSPGAQVPRPPRFVPSTLCIARLCRGDGVDDAEAAAGGVTKESVVWHVSQAALDDFPLAEGA